MSMVGSDAWRLQGAVLLAGAVVLAGCLNSETVVTTDADTGSSSTGAAATLTPTSTSSTSSGETPTGSSSSSSGDASTGLATTGLATTGQPEPICGDGVAEAPETCDDGNPDDSDECPGTCAPAFCGDGFVRAALEQCDDGNKINDDACTSTCTVATCGDGVAQLGVEACDDGDKDDTDYCSSACELAVCGDGFTRAGIEDCDDANAADTDACLVGCIAASCGDGHVQAGVEDCDDANQTNADPCSNKCLPTPKTLQLGVGALTTQYGDVKGGLPFLDACPMGQVLIGFTGVLKVGVHATLGGLCGTPTLAVNADAFVVKVTAGAALPVRGGPGDTPWNRNCGADQVVTGFSGRAGVGLNQLTLSCAPLVVSEAQGGTFSLGLGATTPLPAVGGVGGVAFAQTNCPVGQVASAQNLRASTTIPAFGLGCATISLAN